MKLFAFTGKRKPSATAPTPLPSKASSNKTEGEDRELMIIKRGLEIEREEAGEEVVMFRERQGVRIERERERDSKKLSEKGERRKR